MVNGLLRLLFACLSAFAAALLCASLIIPYADSAISQALSEKTQRSIRFIGGHIAWDRRGPALHYDTANVDGFSLRDVALGLRWKGLSKQRFGFVLQTSALNLDLRRNRIGQWQLAGLSTATTDATAAKEPALSCCDFALDIELLDSTINLIDDLQGIQYALNNVQLRMDRQSTGFALSGSARLDQSSEDLIFEAQINQDEFEAYINFQRLPLTLLARELSGNAKGELWLHSAAKNKLKFRGEIAQLSFDRQDLGFGFDRFDGQVDIENQAQQFKLRAAATICQYQQCFETGAIGVDYVIDGPWQVSIPSFKLNSTLPFADKQLIVGADLTQFRLRGVGARVEQASGRFAFAAKGLESEIRGNGEISQYQNEIVLGASDVKARLRDVAAQIQKLEARFDTLSRQLVVPPIQAGFAGHPFVIRGNWNQKDGAELWLAAENYPVQNIVADVAKALGGGAKMTPFLRRLSQRVQSQSAQLKLGFKVNQALDLQLKTEAATLRFHPDWPVLSVEDLVLHYTVGAALNLQAARGELGGVSIENIEAQSEDLKRQRLAVSGHYTASLAAQKAVLEKTPIATKLAPVLARFSSDAEIPVQLELDVPLKKGLPPTRYQLVLGLEDADITIHQPELQLDRVSGKVFIRNASLSAPSLDLFYLGQPTRASIEYKDRRVTVKGTSHAYVGRLFKQWFPALAPGLSGKTDIDFALAVEPPAAKKQSADFELVIKSQLLGVSRQWPAPFYKPNPETRVEEIWRIARKDEAMNINSVQSQQEFKFNQNADSSWSATIQCDTIDPLGWATYFDARPTVQSIPISMAINCKRAKLGTGTLAEPQIDLQLDKHSTVKFKANGAEGQVLKDQTGLINIELTAFDSRYWSAGSLAGPASATGPISLPAVRLNAANLNLNNIPINRLTVDASPVADLWSMDRIYIELPGGVISGDGLLSGRDRPFSQVQLSASIDNASRLAEALGYGASIDGSGSAIADLGWNAMPWELALNKLQGTLDLTMNDGKLREIQTGAGALLPLLALHRLPEVLSGKIDTAGQGFDFESLNASLSFTPGLANLTNLVIQGPIGVVQMAGWTDLNTRELNHQVVVIPELSAAAPLLGLLAGGPIGGIGTLIVERVLQSAGLDLDQVAGRRYTITGTLDQPEVN